MKIKFYCHLISTLLLLNSTAISFIAFLSCANAQDTSELINKQPYSKKITGKVIPSTIPVNTPLQTDTITITTPFQTNGITTRAIASPANNVSTFNTTVVKNPFSIILYDPSTVDGDIVRLIVNRKVRANSIVLTGAKLEIPIDLKPGVNTIEIAALNEGSVSPNTVGIEYRADQVLERTTVTRGVDLTTGTSFVTSVGFPQIALCKTIFIFPCITQTYPESAQHVLEAQGIPPEPITAPLKSPGIVGNPSRSSYPRLLTIDRDRATARRAVSTRNYQCPNPKIQDKDEYPPAVFLENNYSAHIKCISRGDNRGAGTSIKLQINGYRVTPTSSPVELNDEDVIEFVILR